MKRRASICSAIFFLSLSAASARSDADCGGLTSSYAIKAAAADWTVASADCSAGQTNLTPPAAPMVVTRQKLIATGGGPYRSPSHKHPAGGDPVLGDGEFYEQRVDTSLAGLGPHYEFKRTHRSRVNFKGVLGYGWDHSYDQRILGVLTLSPEEHIAPYCDNTIDYQDGELNLVHFSLVPGTSQWRAPGLSLVLDQVTDSNNYSRWRLVDGEGTTYLFNTVGYLAEIDDAAGNKLQFTWEFSPSFVKFPDDQLHGRTARLTSVVDAARTVHYIYNADNTLACVSLGTTCGTNLSRDPGVLVYFVYTNKTELAAVYHGSGNSVPVERYAYRSATIPSVWPTPYLPLDCVPNAALPGYCHTLCDAPVTGDATTCRNLNYSAPIISYCEGWTCQLSGNPVSTVCSQLNQQQSQPDALCMAQYSMAPDCVTGCIGRFQCKDNVSLSATYAFGGFDDLVHNITDVSDEALHLIVHNDYGENPWAISFDRVIAQHLGPNSDEQNIVSFAYHDLQLERTPPATRMSPGSVADPTNVIAQSLYSEKEVCPVDGTCRTAPDGSCSVVGYGVPKAVGPTIKNPLPVNAVVITDVHGVTRTQYYDDQYNLIREVNDANHEVTDYNYDPNGFLRAIADPSGMRSCFEHDAAGHVRQASTLPAPGYAGMQTPSVSVYLYDAANQLIDAWADVFGTNTKTHYYRDSHHRISIVDHDVQLGQPPQSTVFSYDEDPAPSGVRETPATVVHYDQSVDTYRDFDPSLGGARAVTLDVNGALPEHRYVNYDSYGRIVEEGEVNRFAQQYTYGASDRLVAVAHRQNSSSPWVTTTVSSHESDGPMVDSIGEPGRATTLLYTGRYPNVQYYSPATYTYGEQTKISCLHYDADGRFEGEIYPAGNEVEYAYDASGRVTAKRLGFQTSPPPTAWRKSCNGRPIPTGDTGKQTTASWTYGTGGFLAGFTEGDKSRKVITDGFGRVLQSDATYSTSVDVASVQNGYDSAGRIAWIAEIATAYSMPRTAYAKPTMQTPGLLSMVEFDHDLIGRKTAERHWVIGTGEILSQAWVYDDANRATTRIDRGAATTTKLDARGRLSSRTSADGSLLTVTHYLDYDVITRQTNQAASLTRTVQYDTRGNTTAVLDENGLVLYTASYDDHSNRITERGAGEGTTTRTFDLFDRLYHERKDPLNGPQADHYFGWDANDRLASASGFTLTYTGFDAPLTSTDSLGRVDRLSYVNGFISPAGRVDSTGRHSCYRYDYDVRLAYTYDVDCPNTTDIRGVATPLVERRSLKYTSKGEVATIQATRDAVHSATESVGFLYDSLGRETDEIVTSNDATIESYSVHHDYPDAGRTVSSILSGMLPSTGGIAFNAVRGAIIKPPPTGCPPGVWCPPNQGEPTPFVEAYRQMYDVEDRLFGVDLNGARIATWDFGKGAGGPLSLKYANGSTTAYQYDNRLRQTRMDVTFQAAGMAQPTPIASLADVYGVDSVPRMRQRTIGTGTPITDVFQIDGDGKVTAENLRVQGIQLLKGEVDDAAIAPYLNGGDWRYYDVDGNGNWHSVASYNNGGAVSEQMDALGRLTAVGTRTMSIDAHDNLLGLVGDTLSFTFDSFSGSLATATNGAKSYRYYYDAADRRTAEMGNDGRVTAFFWDRGQIIAHGDPADPTVDVPGADIDSHIASVDVVSGVARYYHQSTDQSVLAVSDSNGLVEGYSYSAFGEETIWSGGGTTRSTSIINNRFGFQGQLYDPGTATYSMRARQYVPAWGRFASPDPLTFMAAPSLYSFTGSRPLSARDPLGLVTDSTKLPPRPCPPGAFGCAPPPEPKGGGGGPDPSQQGGGGGGPQAPAPAPSGGGGGGGGAPPGGGGGGSPGGGGDGGPDGIPPLGGGGPSRDPGGGGPGGGGGVGRGGGVSQFPPDRVFAGPTIAPNQNPFDCDSLAKRIAERVSELATRAQELVADPRNLAKNNWFVRHPKYGSVDGHINQFNIKQRNLWTMLKDWDKNNCGGGLPEQAEEFATRTAPWPANRWDNRTEFNIIPNPSPQQVQTAGWIVVLGTTAVVLWNIFGPVPVPAP